MSLNFWVCGKSYLMKILNPSNSRGLKMKQISYTYANEADLLNTVLFGKTAKEWREENPTEKGNTRDYATLHQLLVFANMES
jgi:hypothetical protein